MFERRSASRTLLNETGSISVDEHRSLPCIVYDRSARRRARRASRGRDRPGQLRAQHRCEQRDPRVQCRLAESGGDRRDRERRRVPDIRAGRPPWKPCSRPERGDSPGPSRDDGHLRACRSFTIGPHRPTGGGAPGIRRDASCRIRKLRTRTRCPHPICRTGLPMPPNTGDMPPPRLPPAPEDPPASRDEPAPEIDEVPGL